MKNDKMQALESHLRQIRSCDFDPTVGFRSVLRETGRGKRSLPGAGGIAYHALLCETGQLTYDMFDPDSLSEHVTEPLTDYDLEIDLNRTAQQRLGLTDEQANWLFRPVVNDHINAVPNNIAAAQAVRNLRDFPDDDPWELFLAAHNDQ